MDEKLSSWCWRTSARQILPALLCLALLTACGGGGGSSGGSSAANGGTSSGSGGSGSGSSGSSSSGSGSSGSSGAGGAGSGGTGSAGSPATTINGTDALRLAEQAAFGPTPALVAAISAQGPAWIDAQIATPATGYAPIAPISSNVTAVCPTGGPDPYCYQNNYTALPVQ